jgi:hypothetical protein
MSINPIGLAFIITPILILGGCLTQKWLTGRWW